MMMMRADASEKSGAFSCQPIDKSLIRTLWNRSDHPLPRLQIAAGEYFAGHCAAIVERNQCGARFSVEANDSARELLLIAEGFCCLLLSCGQTLGGSVRGVGQGVRGLPWGLGVVADGVDLQRGIILLEGEYFDGQVFQFDGFKV
jgi:hypothetical protein